MKRTVTKVVALVSGFFLVNAASSMQGAGDRDGPEPGHRPAPLLPVLDGRQLPPPAGLAHAADPLALPADAYITPPGAGYYGGPPPHRRGEGGRRGGRGPGSRPTRPAPDSLGDVSRNLALQDFGLYGPTTASAPIVGGGFGDPLPTYHEAGSAGFSVPSGFSEIPSAADAASHPSSTQYLPFSAFPDGPIQGYVILRIADSHLTVSLENLFGFLLCSQSIPFTFGPPPASNGYHSHS